MERPGLRLVDGQAVERGAERPLAQREAELMRETVAFLGPRLLTLPPASHLRQSWTRALEDVELAARLQWPYARPRSAAARQRSG